MVINKSSAINQSINQIYAAPKIVNDCYALVNYNMPLID